MLLIPGFLAGDGSLALMANWLRRAGYRPSRAGMLANVDCSGAGHERLEERLERLVAEQGQRAVVDRPEPRRQHGQGARGAAARPGLRPDHARLAAAWTRSPCTRSCALQVEAVSRLGSLGAPRLFKRSCLDGECCASFWEALVGPAAPRRRLRLGLLAQRRRRRLARLPRPGADEHVEIAPSHCGMAVSPARLACCRRRARALPRAEARRRPASAGSPSREVAGSLSLGKLRPCVP